MKRQSATYLDKIGLPPGSLVYIGKQTTQKVTISEIIYTTDHFEDKELNKPSDCTSWNDPDSVTVISINGVHDTSIIEIAGEHFGLEPMIMEDIVNTQSRSKLEEIEDYLFLPMEILLLDPNSHAITTEHISLLLGKSALILFKESGSKILDPLIDRARSGKGMIRQRNSDYMYYRIVDTIVDNYFIVTEHLFDCLEKLEDKILQNPNENVNEDIYQLKKEIAFVKRTISPLRECISSIIKSESGLVSDSTQNYFRDIYDHLIHQIETVDSQRDTINDFLNLYMSAISNKMNEVMKVLTVFAAIFIPLTFIAGIYGMNFTTMPELQWKYGYFIALGIMLCVAILLLFYFRRKRWL